MLWSFFVACWFVQVLLISIASLHSWSNHWFLSLGCMVPVISFAALYIHCLIVEHCCCTLELLVNWLLTYFLVELWYFFTHVASWSLLMSHLRLLVHRCFNRMEILGLYLILIIKWSESLLPPRWLLMSVICEACPLLIITWSIWLAASPSGDIQVWRWIFLCGNMALLMTRSLEVTKSHSLSSLSFDISWRLYLPLQEVMGSLLTLVSMSPITIPASLFRDCLIDSF